MQDWIFWAAVVALSIGVAAILLQSLRSNDAHTDDSALKVYRDQLSEVDRDLARAVISAPEAERLRTEVSRRLLDADRAQQAAPISGGKGKIWPAAAAILLAACAALYTYDRVGTPGYADLPLTDRLALADQAYAARPSQAEAEAAASPPLTAPQPDAEFTELMVKLRAAVQARPDDLQGLALLAKNEAQLGNYVAARMAQQHLLTLLGDKASAEDHAGLAQTMIFAANGVVTPEAEQHQIRALKLDPTNPLARYFSGLMFAEIGRPDRAFALWEPLLREGPADAPWIAPIRGMLQDTADAAGIKYQLPALKGPTSEDVANAGALSAADRQAMIKGMVDQLEARLTTEGGPVEDWVKLMTSLAKLGEKEDAKAAYEQAVQVFKSDTAALGQIEAAASDAGVTP
ncbi:MAG: ccmI [Cypionkella sp.]|uniref:c-type cytochrome biogenesis protein CcmI n=1 Tax=Cypionkella sp. TaxID=2811411 RepID=UPI00260358EC|nr:c-type cytochrome biogenesis protein CcmI [Cypionkella sp.]MDB5660690.1 ccmI [Cypionkella sp.]